MKIIVFNCFFCFFSYLYLVIKQQNNNNYSRYLQKRIKATTKHNIIYRNCDIQNERN